MSRFRLRYKATNFELQPGEFGIGRSSACSLAVADGLVSRRHAMLHVGPDSVVLEDLGSRNGVSVNGVRISGRHRLSHMDRVYIGAQELVLIDAIKMGEHLTTDGHVACDSCGAINGEARRFCGDCGERLRSSAGTTQKGGSSDRAPEHNWGDSSDTHSARALDVLGNLASKAIIMGRFDEAERILIPHLHALLERAMRQHPLSDSERDDPDAIFDAATKHALHLAHGLHHGAWIDWLFRIHTATGKLMTAETIEALHEMVRSHDYKKGTYVHAYLHVIRQRASQHGPSEYGPSERFLVGRLEGLAEVILARAR